MLFENDIFNKALISTIYKELIFNSKKEKKNLSVQRTWIGIFFQRHRTAKHMKRCSKLLIIKEMKIKIIMGCCLTPFKLAIFKNITK